MKSRDRTVFFAVIILLSAAVVLYALFGHSTSVDTASVILPTPLAGGDAPGSPGVGESGLTLALVTPDTVQAAIGTLSRAESYSRTVTVEDFWDGGSGSAELSVWADAGSLRVRLASGDDFRNILLKDGQLTIWYDRAEGVYASPWDGDAASADRWLRCLTYEELLALPASDITAAGYGQYAGEACVYAEYASGSFGYRSVVYVSVNTGLLMGAETYDGDTLIYRMTSGAPDLTAPDPELFQPPRGS